MRTNAPARGPAPDQLGSSGHVNVVLHPGRLLTSETRISTMAAARKVEIVDFAVQFKTLRRPIVADDTNA